MAKFYGAIGYVETIEAKPGVWTERVTERKYFGDLIRNTRKLQGTNQINDDIAISNDFSIIADPYAIRNFHSMRYLEFMGTKWKITNVEVRYPRLVLTVGGLYHNGEQA